MNVLPFYLVSCSFALYIGCYGTVVWLAFGQRNKKKLCFRTCATTEGSGQLTVSLRIREVRECLRHPGENSPESNLSIGQNANNYMKLEKYLTWSVLTGRKNMKTHFSWLSSFEIPISSRFFTLIGAYLVFGTLFQYSIGKRGKRMFPNHDFWCITIPGLCKVS